MPIPPTFYSFTLLPLKNMFCGGVVWARCPYLLLFTLLLFYSFTFKQKRECVPYVYATTDGTHSQYSISKIERVYLKYIYRSFPYLRTFA